MKRYNRIIDDDGPSCRSLFPHPYLADGSGNPDYIEEAEHMEMVKQAMKEMLPRGVVRGRGRIRIAPLSMPTVGMALIGMRVRASDIVGEG